jgi:hypothetical protein
MQHQVQRQNIALAEFKVKLLPITVNRSKFLAFKRILQPYAL